MNTEGPDYSDYSDYSDKPAQPDTQPQPAAQQPTLFDIGGL